MPTSDSSPTGFLSARVIHLHPSRFCNLSCAHCYSASGPSKRHGLDPSVITDSLSTLRGEGYEVLSLSGGEPLLYSGFESVVRSASNLGFRVNLISNGSPVGGRILDIISESVDLVAISLDGAPETHIQMRGDVNAFKHAERAIDRLASTEVRYGIAYCLSRQSLADMPWALEFADRKNASLVQFHPIAAMGRGRTLSESVGLDESDKARAYVIAALLDTGKGPVIQLDLVPTEIARARRTDYAVFNERNKDQPSLSDLVNPLIIDETGQLLPFVYGINTRFSLGKIGHDLMTSIDVFKDMSWRNLYMLLDFSFMRLGAKGENFVDWYLHIAETSYL